MNKGDDSLLKDFLNMVIDAGNEWPQSIHAEGLTGDFLDSLKKAKSVAEDALAGRSPSGTEDLDDPLLSATRAIRKMGVTEDELFSVSEEVAQERWTPTEIDMRFLATEAESALTAFRLSQLDKEDWMFAGAACRCVGEGGEIFEIDAVDWGREAAYLKAVTGGCDAGWEGFGKLSPVDRSEVEKEAERCRERLASLERVLAAQSAPRP